MQCNGQTKKCDYGHVGLLGFVRACCESAVAHARGSEGEVSVAPQWGLAECGKAFICAFPSQLKQFPKQIIYIPSVNTVWSNVEACVNQYIVLVQNVTDVVVAIHRRRGRGSGMGHSPPPKKIWKI